jgi:uncharacterized membrane protein YpjA
MNIFDGLATAYLIDYGIAREANPLMDFLIQKSIWLFLAVKLGLGSIMIIMMNNGLHHRSFRFAIFLCSIVYFWIVVNHFSIIHQFFELMKNCHCIKL